MRYTKYIVLYLPLFLLILFTTMFLIDYFNFSMTYKKYLEHTEEAKIQELVASRKYEEFYERFHEGRDYNRNISYFYNQFGFRYNTNTYQEITKNSIMMLGDSIAEGQFLYYNETIPHYLSIMLEKPVYNLGRIGADSNDEYLILNYFFDFYDPKLVIWQWCINDYSNYYVEYQAYLKTLNSTKSIFKPFFKKNQEKKIFVPKEDYNLSALFENIERTRKKENITYVFIMFPVMEDLSTFNFGDWKNDLPIYYYNAYYQDFKNQVLDYDYYLIEVNETISDFSYEDDNYVVIKYDPHPSSKTNKILAERLYDIIIEKELV